MKDVKDFIPDLGKQLVKIGRKEVIDKIGREVITDIVASILSGGNVRSLTEGVTRRRLTLSNASMLFAYTHAMSNIPNFIDNPSEVIKQEFLKHRRLTEPEKNYLNWMIGLSGKGIQNILRDEPENLDNYLKILDEELEEAAIIVRETFGDMRGTFQLEGVELTMRLDNLLRVFMAMGAQTLTIRGSEKSVYGKLFERLVLGSLLTVLGFELIHKDEVEKSDMVFWLTEQKDKREADATLLVRAGIGARFDIGFIGRGNTEISLDKVSRFEREVERGRQKHFMSTIVLVDRIGDRSRIQEMAKLIEGEIVQMSMSYWVKEVAQLLYNRIGLETDFLAINNEESLKLITQKMRSVNLHQFIDGMREEEE